VFFLYLTGSTYWAIIQDTVPGAHVGGVSGFVHALANCSGIIGPSVTGLIVDRTGSFTSAFVLAGGIAILGVLAVLVFVRPLELVAPVRAGV
jgi:ACS family hexuronate transporter-like MFS transporter